MEGQEETRKIQFTGKSSYIISLPKQWVTDLGLKKGDQVRVARKGSSVLQVYPPKFQTVRIQKDDATIEIGVEEDDTVIRKLISLYFLGFKTIHVKSREKRLKPSQRTAIKDAVKRMLMGSEITSDSSSGMTIQVLVNLLELTVSGAFKRMIHLSKSMLEDAILAVSEENFELAEEVMKTDDEVDRFGFYIIRQLKIAIQNEYMLKEMGFENARNCLGYRLVIKNIERTGDHAVIIARDLCTFKRGIRGEALTRIQEMNKFAVSILDDACLALFKEDFCQAEQTIRDASRVVQYEKRVMESTKDLKDHQEIYHIRRTTENIRRIAEYASDIAEIVLNMTIEKTLRKE